MAENEISDPLTITPFVATSLETLVGQMKNFIQWRVQCVELLNSAFVSRNRIYMIFALRFTARFFYVRGDRSIAIKLTERALDLAKIKAIQDEIQGDLCRYIRCT